MNTTTKKIGYLVPEFPGQTHIFFWREIQAIRNMGHELQIISTKKGDVSKVEHDFAKSGSKETFYMHPPTLIFFIFLLLHPLWVFKSMGYIIKLDCNIISKCKILYFLIPASGLIHFCKKEAIEHVHGHSCANVAHILAIAALSKNFSYSLTLHGGLSIYGDNHTKKMENASFVSCVTKPLREEIHKNTGLPYEKIPVISMGVDLDKFSMHARVFNKSKPLNFVTIARLSQGKGHTFSLQALKRLKDRNISFTFKIVGGGEYREYIEDEIIKLGLEKEVTMTGSLSEDDVLDILITSDIFLLTSVGEFEAAPVSVMEAMACGIPTITSIIGGTKDMISHDIDGFLIEQENVDQIESALLKFDENRDILERMSISARIKSEQLFDFRIQAKKLMEEIEKYTKTI